MKTRASLNPHRPILQDLGILLSEIHLAVGLSCIAFSGVRHSIYKFDDEPIHSELSGE